VPPPRARWLVERPYLCAARGLRACRNYARILVNYNKGQQEHQYIRDKNIVERLIASNHCHFLTEGNNMPEHTEEFEQEGMDIILENTKEDEEPTEEAPPEEPSKDEE
jgi:hypothetical protein